MVARRVKGTTYIQSLASARESSVVGSKAPSRPWDSPKDEGKTPDDGYYAKSFNDTKKTVTLNAYAVCTPTGAR